MCRREEGTYLRHISPVSVMLGCQILVKHFTLGGCNTERGHKSPQYIPAMCMCVLTHRNAHPLHPLVSNCYA